VEREPESGPPIIEPIVTIDSGVLTEIKQQLLALEEAEGIRILYALESGSRAWGFPSRDSDYDVRFIYCRPIEWYLSVDLESKRDVIERPISGAFDFGGWDIRKALKLFAKSNPPLLEWLDSSIVYIDRFSFVERLRAMREAFFSPQACAYHYLHMAQGNYRTYLRGGTVWLKKYFYVLRPLLAVRWIEQRRGIVPMLFSDLLKSISDHPDLLREVQQLLQRKIAGDELDKGAAIPVIQDFITVELSRMETMKIDQLRAQIDSKRLNDLFRTCLRDVWCSNTDLDC
jgi:predicted nucleotidyltransferase